MKAKKPLILAVLILALIAVALVLPAAATAKQDDPKPNQPVAWVSYAAARPFLDADDKLVGLNQQAVSVHLYGDGTIQGHATLQVIKSESRPRMILMAGQDDFVIATSFLDPRGLGFMFVASFDALVWVPGDEENGPVLNPEGLTDPAGNPIVFPMVLPCFYIDGGGPGSLNDDWFLCPGIGVTEWGNPPLGEIKVHVK